MPKDIDELLSVNMTLMFNIVSLWTVFITLCSGCPFYLSIPISIGLAVLVNIAQYLKRILDALKKNR